jgi:ABC-2 type transport system permease protein
VNPVVVRLLVLKDWYLNRIAIGLVLGGTIFGLALSAVEVGPVASAGLSILACTFISLTFYLPLQTVLQEREQKTLPFILSLPVSPRDYVAAKILANILIFLVPLLSTAAGVALVFESNPLTTQLEGPAPAVLLGALLFFVCILAFAIISESTGWTVALTVSLMFVTFNVAGRLLAQFEPAAAFLAQVRVRGPAFYWTIGAELLMVAAIVAVTFWAHGRKRDYL